MYEYLWTMGTEGVDVLSVCPSWVDPQQEIHVSPDCQSLLRTLFKPHCRAASNQDTQKKEEVIMSRTSRHAIQYLPP